MSQKQEPRSHHERMLTASEVAERLGLQPETIRSWMARRRITFSKLGRAVRIPESEVSRLIEAGSVPARVDV